MAKRKPPDLIPRPTTAKEVLDLIDGLAEVLDPAAVAQNAATQAAFDGGASFGDWQEEQVERDRFDALYCERSPRVAMLRWKLALARETVEQLRASMPKNPQKQKNIDRDRRLLDMRPCYLNGGELVIIKNGYTYKQIAATLNREGFTTDKGERLDDDGVKRLWHQAVERCRKAAAGWRIDE